MEPVIYVVGGAVRDILLEKIPKDIDYVVVGADHDYMVNTLGLKPIEAGFNIYLDSEKREYSLARNLKGEHLPTNTLEEDLLSRDLSINALAMRKESFDSIWKILTMYHGDFKILYGLIPKKIIHTRMLFDYSNGYQHIKEQKLHAVDGFPNDPLRVLRLARFASIYGDPWEITDLTFKYISDIQELGVLKNLPPERIVKEMEYVFANATTPVTFFTLLNHFEVLDQVFPGLTIEDLSTSSFGRYIIRDYRNLYGYNVPMMPDNALARFFTMYAKVTQQRFDAVAKQFKLSSDILNIMNWVESFNHNMRTDLFDETKGLYRHTVSEKIYADRIIAFYNECDFFRNEEKAIDFLNNYVPYDYYDFFKIVKDVAFKDLTSEEVGKLKGRDIAIRINEIRIARLDKHIFDQKRKFKRHYSQFGNIKDYTTIWTRLQDLFNKK
jgi:tRNA nucleotidyltransferase/poly(A) polymerase